MGRARGTMFSIAGVLLMVAALSPRTAEADSGVGGLSFRNLVDRSLMLYWVSHDGSFKRQARLPAGAQTGFQTYAGHRFIWAELDARGEEPASPTPIDQFTIRNDQMIYAYTDETTPLSHKEALEKEMDFRDEYHDKNGFHWVATSYPRPPVTLPMLKPKRVGEILPLNLTDPLAAAWHCVEEGHSNSECLNRGVQPVQAAAGGSLEIRVVSLFPKVFEVSNFLSDFEADYLKEQARPKLSRSTVGSGINAQVDNTRRSKGARLTRAHSQVLDSIYRRVAAVTALPQQLVDESSIAEPLNVLNYPQGAEYTPHYDWSASGSPYSRWLSGLIYLNTPLKGGATAFPKAQMPGGKVGTTVKAVKRNFVFFYNLLEDGNGDVLSLHAGLPVESASKWVAPLWLWEPSYNGVPHGFGDISNRGMSNRELLAQGQQYGKTYNKPVREPQVGLQAEGSEGRESGFASGVTNLFASFWGTDDL